MYTKIFFPSGIMEFSSLNEAFREPTQGFFEAPQYQEYDYSQQPQQIEVPHPDSVQQYQQQVIPQPQIIYQPTNDDCPYCKRKSNNTFFIIIIIFLIFLLTQK